jgi:hypothetical protein
MIFATARAVWYPFWAADASHEQLMRSWGGPSPVGATVVHWIVALITLLAGYAMIWAAEYLLTNRLRP